MPKLKILLACEKVINDVTGPVSLISVFQRMNVPIGPAPLPEKALSPTRWDVFSMWEFDAKEVGQEFIQVVKVGTPDGSVFAEMEWPIKSESPDQRHVNVKTTIPGIPIWQEGFVTINTWLKGEESIIGDFRYEVRYIISSAEVTP
jgi:hypothetical protein